MNKKYSKLSKNIILFSFGSMGEKVLNFLLIPLYTNYLSTIEYGTINLLTNTVNLIIPIFTLNIQEAVLRFTLKSEDNSNYFTYGVITIIRGGFLLFSLSCFIYFLPFFSFLRNYLGLLVILYFSSSFFGLLKSFLKAINKSKLMVVTSFIGTFVTLVSAILLVAIFKWAIKGYYIAIIIGHLVGILFCFVNGKIYKRINFSISEKSILRAKCLKYCIPTVFTSISWWVNSSLDQYFVTAFCGVEQNGLYAVAYKIPSILSVLQSVFNQAWMLSVVVEFDNTDKDNFISKTFDFYITSLLICTSLILILNIPLSRILYAKDFFIAWKIVPCLLVASFFSAAAGYLGGIFSAVKDTKICAQTTIISAAINTSLNFFLIPKFNLYGAAVATCIAYFIAFFIRAIKIRKYIVLKINIKKDIIGMLLVLLHTILASFERQYYLLQLLLIILLIINYSNYIKNLLNKFKKKDVR